MTVSLYAATVPGWLQILGALDGLIGKARAFAAGRGDPDAALIEARLAPDMLPFGYQVKSCRHHSLGAIEGVRGGVFRPDRQPWPDSFAGLADQVAETRAALAALDPAEVDGFAGGDMRFEAGPRVLPFEAEDFLLSFSVPNFHFHATTAYAILRAGGVEIGKRDFLGTPRVRPAS